MPLTRREFLMRVGHAGGYSATFATTQSLGLLPATTAVSMISERVRTAKA